MPSKFLFESSQSTQASLTHFPKTLFCPEHSIWWRLTKYCQTTWSRLGVWEVLASPSPATSPAKLFHMLHMLAVWLREGRGSQDLAADNAGTTKLMWASLGRHRGVCRRNSGLQTNWTCRTFHHSPRSLNTAHLACSASCVLPLGLSRISGTLGKICFSVINPLFSVVRVKVKKSLISHYLRFDWQMLHLGFRCVFLPRK